MDDSTNEGRRPQSAVDATRPTSQANNQARTLFRARALEQLDVATEIDNQLPLVPRHTALIVVGIALVTCAGILWAALTPSQTSVTATGRAVASSGISQVHSMVPGVIGSAIPVSGQTVAAGQTLFEVDTMSGKVPVTSMSEGTVWQVLTSTGAGVTPSDALATVLPTGSDTSLLVAVPEAESNGVAEGQQVVVQGQPNGTVAMLTPPLPVSEVAPKTGLTLDPDGFYTIVTVNLADPIAAGTEVSARIVLTDTSVLSRILGF